MSETFESFSSPAGWTLVFTIASYLMALSAIFGGIRKGLAALDRPKRAVAEQLLAFAVLMLLFWALESLAHSRAPYYVYSSAFGDLIPRIRFEQISPIFDTPLRNACTDLVQSSGVDGKIPLSVILLEASLTYASLWTARLLDVALWAQPVFAGLAMVTVDALLDPIVAAGHGCSIAPLPASGNGVGLWHWFSPTAADLVGVNQNPLAQWFHIPLFNYGAWLGAPIVALSLINLSGFTRDWLDARERNARERGARLCGPLRSQSVLPGVQLLVGVILVAGVFVVVAIAPTRDPSTMGQTLIIGAALLAALVVFTYQLGKLQTTERVDPSLTTPVSVALVVPSAAGLVSGQFVSRPWLLPVAVISLLLGLWLGWLPYVHTLRRFAKALERVDKFVRLHYFGFTAMLVLLGASFFDKSPNTATLFGLLIIAGGFHVFSYVLNDVIDLDVDRHHPLRQNDPMVLGLIPRDAAIAWVITTIPATLLASNYLHAFELRRPWSLLSLGLAFGLMWIYNLYGKLCRVPMVTDLVQALGWALLVFAGALTRTDEGRPISLELAWERCNLLFVYGAAFIFLINGIHGGLRDLKNDLKHDRWTTARYLGATPNADDSVTSSWKVIAFAYAVHAVHIGSVAAFLVREAGLGGAFESGTELAVVALLCGLTFCISLWVLWRVVRIHQADRKPWLSWHLVLLLLPPIIVFSGAKRPETVFKLVVVLSFFVPLILRGEYLGPFFEWAYDRGAMRSWLGRALAALPRSWLPFLRRARPRPPCASSTTCRCPGDGKAAGSSRPQGPEGLSVADEAGE